MTVESCNSRCCVGVRLPRGASLNVLGTAEDETIEDKKNKTEATHKVVRFAFILNQTITKM